jgi:pimeloyl-ACP methyl ester carboxylesterase
VCSAPESAGYPVFVHPGTPGSRLLFAPNVKAAAERGLRLISWDRPGYGDTPRAPGRTIADGVVDAREVAAAFGLTRFATWGFSGGGGFALACAALLPDAVSAAVVIASLAPHSTQGLDWTRNGTEASRAEVRLFFDDREAARQTFRVDGARYYDALTSPDGWFARWGDVAGTDDAHSRAVAEHLALTFGEALKNGDEGWWEDWVAYLSPWGFDLADIRVPVQLWHGVGDAAAEVHHGRWLAEHVPGVDAHLIDGDDHTDIEALHQAEAWDWIVTTSRH